jgi:hypothetical protein
MILNHRNVSKMSTDMIQEYRSLLTEEMAIYFVNNPNINPVTGAKIRKGKDRYNILVTLAREMYKLDVLPKKLRDSDIALPTARLREPVLRIPDGLIEPPPTLLNWFRCWTELPNQRLPELIDACEERIFHLYSQMEEAWDTAIFSSFELEELMSIVEHLDKDFRTDYTVSRPCRTKLNKLIRMGNQWLDKPILPEDIEIFRRHGVVFRRHGSNVRTAMRACVSHIREMLCETIYRLQRNKEGIQEGMRMGSTSLEKLIPFPELLVQTIFVRRKFWVDELCQVAHAFHIFPEPPLRMEFAPWLTRMEAINVEVQELLQQFLFRHRVMSWEEIDSPAEKIFATSECPVCWEEMETGPGESTSRAVCIHPCGHCICLECVRGIQQVHNTICIKCPQCKQASHSISFLRIDS